MGAPGSEVGQPAPLGRPNAPGRLGGQRGLEAHLVDDVGLDQLGLDDRRGHLQHRLVGKEKPTLGDCSDVSGEADAAQILKEVVAEDSGRTEVIHRFAVKAQQGEIVEHIIQPGRHQVAAIGRVAAHGEAEGGRGVHRLAEIRLGHGQLVKVR